MLDPKDYNHLREFVSLVEQMQNLALTTRVLAKNEIILRMYGADSEILNFDEEECRSFLLDCRLLIQDNDRISIGCVWRIFKDRINDPEWFVRINPPKWKLNEFLEQQCSFAAPGGGTTTYRELLYTFLYGAYAHRGMNPKLRERFLQWQTADQQFLFIKLQFLLILKVLIKTAIEMNDVVEEWMSGNPEIKPVEP